MDTVQTHTTTELWPVKKIKPYKRNAKAHPPEQIERLAKLFQRHGFDVPIVVDAKGVIVKGHGRWLAAQHLGMTELPVIVRADYTPAQAAEARLADNRVAEFGYDFDVLRDELLISQELSGFDVDVTGFSLDALTSDVAAETEKEVTEKTRQNDRYTGKVKAPVYEPTQEVPPKPAELFDTTKTAVLLAQIAADKNLPKDVRAFLVAAAQRHTVFDFQAIAEFYAHAPANVQALMEVSALVIVDFNKAIEGGFVQLTEELRALAAVDESAQDDA